MPEVNPTQRPPKVSFDLDEKLLAQLREHAEKNDRTVSAEIRRALRYYLSGAAAEVSA